MHIACVKNHGIGYLQVMDSYSVKEDGVFKSRKHVVRNLGPLSRFDDGKPGYLTRLRKSFKEGYPLITELADLVQGSPVKDRITIHNFILPYTSKISCNFNDGRRFLLC